MKNNFSKNLAHKNKRITVHPISRSKKYGLEKMDSIRVYGISGTIRINAKHSNSYGIAPGKELFLKDESGNTIISGVLINGNLNQHKSEIKFSGIFTVKYKHQLDELNKLDHGDDNLRIVVQVFTRLTGTDSMLVKAASIESIEEVTNKLGELVSKF